MRGDLCECVWSFFGHTVEEGVVLAFGHLDGL